MQQKKNSRVMNVVAVVCLCAVFALAVVAATMGSNPNASIPESAKVTPAPADRVYVTPSGTRYHRRSCTAIEDSGIVTGYSPLAARRKGYSPCQICEP